MARFNKKTKKKKRPTLSPISAEEQDLLHSILTNLAQVDPHHIKDHVRNPAFAVNLLEELPADAPETLDLIAAIRDTFEEREVQKSIKKTLFRLRRQGISFPELEAPKEAPLIMEGPKSPDPEAYVGPIDGNGTRGVLFVMPRVPKGVDIGIGLVNSDDGVMQFVYSRNSKKRSREIKEFFQEQVGKSVETSLSHAATLIENAYNKTPAPKETARDYLRLRPWILENFPLCEQPVIYDFIHAEDVSSEMLTDTKIKKLLDHEFMLSWIISPDEIQPLMDDISKAEESPIIISDEQKIDRVNEIKEKFITELYPEQKRRRLKQDLEEMAYLFYKRDEEEVMRICISSAKAVDEKESSFRVNSFLKGYLEHSLNYYYHAMGDTSGLKDPGDHSSSMIITP